MFVLGVAVALDFLDETFRSIEVTWPRFMPEPLCVVNDPTLLGNISGLPVVCRASAHPGEISLYPIENVPAPTPADACAARVVLAQVGGLRGSYANEGPT